MVVAVCLVLEAMEVAHLEELQFSHLHQLALIILQMVRHKQPVISSELDNKAWIKQLMEMPAPATRATAAVAAAGTEGSVNRCKVMDLMLAVAAARVMSVM